MQRTSTFKSTATNIHKGMFGVIQEYNLPPNEWRLGIVEKVDLSTEAFTGIAEIRTSYELIQRPVFQLFMVSSG